jgi:nicotinamidase-related amidase
MSGSGPAGTSNTRSRDKLRGMAHALAVASRSVLIVVDIQPSFLKVIHEGERVARRSEFLIRIANLLEVPVLATEQNPERMGHTHESLLPHLVIPAIPKMTFSCVGCGEFDDALASLFPTPQAIAERGSRQAIIVGIETHICVTQTALHLVGQGFDVKVCEDAVSARAKEMNDIGFRRLRHAGVDVAHSESIAYEWLQRADHPKFREALPIVKECAGL